MRNKRGFTLIEILVVITVILILVGMILSVSGMLRRKAGEVRTIQRMEEIQRELASVGRSKGNTAYVLQKQAGLPGVLTYTVDDTSLEASAVNLGEGALTYSNDHEFEYPWGKLVDSDGDGSTEAVPLPRNLSQLSADKSAELMKLAGMLPPDDPATTGVDEALQAYATDRGPDQPFNDHWGNPLVVVYGVFQPEAERLQDIYQTYGYNRSVYIAVGAGGPMVTAPVSPLDAPALWVEIADRAKAAEWTEASWDSAPWTGVRVEKDGRKRAFVSTPIELK
jgi:prepilin-type N-terminal cleavage/methylation domain-containing protein